MWTTITSLFRNKTADELAAKQLADAERHLLEAESHAEYYKHMVAYYRQTVDRLQLRDNLKRVKS